MSIPGRSKGRLDLRGVDVRAVDHPHVDALPHQAPVGRTPPEASGEV